MFTHTIMCLNLYKILKPFISTGFIKPTNIFKTIPRVETLKINTTKKGDPVLYGFYNLSVSGLNFYFNLQLFV